MCIRDRRHPGRARIRRRVWQAPSLEAVAEMWLGPGGIQTWHWHLSRVAWPAPWLAAGGAGSRVVGSLGAEHSSSGWFVLAGIWRQIWMKVQDIGLENVTVRWIPAHATHAM
eukprot:4415816-Karenia_brevis.AAC.1